MATLAKSITAVRRVFIDLRRRFRSRRTFTVLHRCRTRRIATYDRPATAMTSGTPWRGKPQQPHLYRC